MLVYFASNPLTINELNWIESNYAKICGMAIHFNRPILNSYFWHKTKTPKLSNLFHKVIKTGPKHTRWHVCSTLMYKLKFSGEYAADPLARLKPSTIREWVETDVLSMLSITPFKAIRRLGEGEQMWSLDESLICTGHDLVMGSCLVIAVNRLSALRKNSNALIQKKFPQFEITSK